MRRTCLFWNVQRFFDLDGRSVARALDGVGVNWTDELYHRKLFNVSRVLRAAFPNDPPALIALAEVESTRILRDLRSILGWHTLVATDELHPDPTLEGLDVAALLDGSIFDLPSLSINSLSLDSRFSTRDLLEIRVKPIHSGQQAAIFIAHWPSRLISEGIHLRFAYSINLHRRIHNTIKYPKEDIVTPDGSHKLPDPATLSERWQTPCLIMGDFNDEPFDDSIRVALDSTRFLDLVARQGKLTGKSSSEVKNYLDKQYKLYNPCWALSFSDNGKVGGSFYRSEWRSYDQIMFSHGALSKAADLQYVDHSVRIFRLPGLKENGINVKMASSREGLPRAFSRSEQEGVSDHFPILFDIELRTVS